MSKKKDIESILDECLDRLMFNGETLEECLRDYPEHADELRPLLEAALVTSKVSALEPSTQFREKARIQMYSELQGLEAKKSRTFFGFSLQPRWVTVVAVVIALFLATGGTAAAASGSMPDDFLYPVKRATEQVQLAFTFTTLGKAEFHARMADRRVEEIVYLANKDKTEKIELLASNLNTNLTEIAALTSSQDTTAVTREEEEAVLQAGEAAAVAEEAEYEDWEGTEESVLAARAPELDEESGAEETAPGAAVTAKGFKALEKADVTAANATALTPVPALTAEKATATEVTTNQQKQKGQNGKDEEEEDNDRRTQLNITVINQANKNITRLHDLLDVVSEADKPIIQRAIDISEDGYEKAIESLEQ